MTKLFGEKSILGFRRPRNLEVFIVGSNVKQEDNSDIGMTKCGVEMRDL